MSTICQRFAQNAWKKDLCSNCFKSKEEHKAANADVKPIKFPSTRVPEAPAKGIMKLLGKTKRKNKVSFPKDVAQVIGFGGDWSDLDAESDSDTEALPPKPTADDITKEIDELEQELVKLTKVNTNYNQSNGNLLGDAEANIKRSFAALQLGSGKADSDGKKQTLKISVMPFGGPVTTNKVNDIKQKFCGVSNETETTAKLPVVLKTIIKTSGVEYVEEPTLEALLTPIAKAPIVKSPSPEKSLMDEISETLEKKNKEKQDNKIKLEISSKRAIQRHAPIVKDQAKPKISVFPKTSDTDSNQSDTENSSSGYYDVVEASTRYENISDDFSRRRDSARSDDMTCEIRNKNESSFFSNHLISEMFSSNKDRKNSYSFMSEITSDGLIVTKASSDDAMDSTGSSFDYATSSDEELSSMNRSESDSGIGICVNTSNDYKKFDQLKNNDYEDVQVQVEKPTITTTSKLFSVNKSREMAGEPDGSADPDGSAEAPALPSSPPPANAESRLSFLHQNSTQKSEKPAVPIKPTVSIIKAFVKRTPNTAEQQVMSELQNHMLKHSTTTTNEKTNIEKPTLIIKQDSESPKGGLKKSRAPDPPSPTTSEEIDINNYEDLQKNIVKEAQLEMFEINLNSPTTPSGGQNSILQQKSKTDDQYSFLYTRNPTGSVSKSTSPVIREKDKRERATINPKFRSLNTFSTQYKNQQAEKLRSTTPEPAPRKSLSMSQDCLLDDKKKKTKFSIKKFLRISTNKSSDPIYDKKDGVYGKRTSVDEDLPQVKPRLVIIHPIDINNMEVEVVKEMGKVNEIVTGKPPAPPLRKGLDLSKPIRPPPPKSAEVRKKLKLGISDSKPPSPKASKEDNVYANLGEIRSAIAPRKPERTASMREREVQMELARKRLSKLNNDDDDIDFSPIPSSASSASTLERNDVSATKKTKATSDASPKFSTRLELFEKGSVTEHTKVPKQSLFTDGIKSSIQKMNNTIDSYLKDRLVGEVDTPPSVVAVQQVKLPQPAPPVRISTVQMTPTIVASAVPAVVIAAPMRTSEVELRTTYEPILVNTQRSSLPDSSMNIYGGNESPAMLRSGYCKSDIGVNRYRNQNLGELKSYGNIFSGTESISISVLDLHAVLLI